MEARKRVDEVSRHNANAVVSLSPCLLVSLSPCLLAVAAWLILPSAGTAADKPADPAAELKNLRDVYPPVQLPAPPAKTSPWVWAATVVGGLVLVAALLFGSLEFRRRLHRPGELSPREWALRELDRIAGMGVPANGDVEHYHTLLSDVIRQYVDRNWHTHAQKQTTAEFLENVRQSTVIAAEQQKQLQELLEACDLAKFARVEVAGEEWQRVVAEARTLVEVLKAEERKV